MPFGVVSEVGRGMGVLDGSTSAKGKESFGDFSSPLACLARMSALLSAFLKIIMYSTHA